MLYNLLDIVLRVIAAQLEPSNCSVVRVMTPHPDTAPSSMTIMDALRKMHGMPFVLSGVILFAKSGTKLVLEVLQLLLNP